MLDTRAYVKMMNGVQRDIIRFIKAAFDSRLAPLSFNNIIVGDELKYVVKDLKPDLKGSSDTDLLITGTLPDNYNDSPYIQVGSFMPEPQLNINIESISKEGTYQDDNGDVKKGVLLGQAVNGNMTLNVGAFTQNERNLILEWLLIYFSIGSRLLEVGSEELGIDGNIGVGSYKVTVNDSPQKIVNDRLLWKGQFKMNVAGFWEVFVPLEGVFNGVNVDTNYFLNNVREFLENE